jgi:hypothetical protein
VREALDIAVRMATKPEASADDLTRAADTLLASGRDAQTALEFASRAAQKTGGTNPAALLTLAQARQASGDAAGARQAATKILELVPAPAPGEPVARLRRLAEKLAR